MNEIIIAIIFLTLFDLALYEFILGYLVCKKQITGRLHNDQI